jgi:hypothetical protein
MIMFIGAVKRNEGFQPITCYKETSAVIAKALTWLKENRQIHPTYTLTDKSLAELNAIAEVFSGTILGIMSVSININCVKYAISCLFLMLPTTNCIQLYDDILGQYDTKMEARTCSCPDFIQNHMVCKHLLQSSLQQNKLPDSISNNPLHTLDTISETDDHGK